jgi:hypothetical protein
MKKLLLALLVSLGLQTQAQINPCDSIEYTITSSANSIVLQLDGVVNGFCPTNFPCIVTDWYWSTDANCGPDTGQTVYFPNTFCTFTTADTLNLCLTTVIDYMGTTFTCTQCDTLVFGPNGWMKMMVQQPYFCCDSISYWTDQSQGFNVGLDTTGIIHNPDSIEVWWAVCTGYAGTGMCYSDQGMYAYFPQVTTSDTVKVGYDVYLYENGVAEVCSREDWLVFDGTNWVLLNMNPTSINELEFIWEDDGIIYDLTGRKLKEIPVGKLYIRNRQLYIKQ